MVSANALTTGRTSAQAIKVAVNAANGIIVASHTTGRVKYNCTHQSYVLNKVTRGKTVSCVPPATAKAIRDTQTTTHAATEARAHLIGVADAAAGGQRDVDSDQDAEL